MPARREMLEAASCLTGAGSDFFFLKKNTLSATSGDNNYETMVQALKGARISK